MGDGYDSSRCCEDCGEKSPWAALCHTCAVVRRIEKQHEGETVELRATVATLRAALEACRREADCVRVRLGPSTDGESIDSVTAERAWCDADTIYCAAAAALASTTKPGETGPTTHSPGCVSDERGADSDCARCGEPGISDPDFHGCPPTTPAREACGHQVILAPNDGKPPGCGLCGAAEPVEREGEE
jgi:hypothetical protein